MGGRASSWVSSQRCLGALVAPGRLWKLMRAAGSSQRCCRMSSPLGACTAHSRPLEPVNATVKTHHALCSQAERHRRHSLQ